MKTLSQRLKSVAFILIALIAGASVYTWNARASKQISKQHKQNGAPEKIDVSGYRGWTRVNPTPMLMDALTSALCARSSVPPPDASTAGVGVQNPHRNKYITVYVNELGKHAMMSEASPKFPEGSIIVKEKLSSRESTEPELLTVMWKREKGFNPESGDWEYLIFNGEGTAVSERGRLESCQACHAMHQATDYVTRLYLPAEVRRQLR